MEGKTIIEVNGIKLEVDLRTARRIDELRIGDRVKVLRTDSYDKTHKVYAGTIVGFDPFKAMPTITVAYIENDYSRADVKFIAFNSQTTGIEIIKSIDDDQLELDKTDILQKFEIEIERKRREIAEIIQRRDFFLSKFGQYWEAVTQEAL